MPDTPSPASPLPFDGERAAELLRHGAAPATEETRINGGIEWFKVPLDNPRGGCRWDCQCARCGSSVEFVDCANCDDGFVERDFGDDACEDLYDVPCEWCNGAGSTPHCVSSPEWCNAHPIPGREHIESTAMSSEAWRDYL